MTTPVLSIDNTRDYNARTKSGLVVIDFYADRCPPCKILSPKMDELALQYAGKVSFYKVNVDVANELAQSQEITSLPTLLFYQNGVIASLVPVWVGS